MTDVLPTVLVLTPVKDAAVEAVGYIDRLLALDYPKHLLSLGVLVSDSIDESSAAYDRESRRPEIGEVETEGLAIMANDMGITCWGLPDVEIRHR
ncbi:MAG: hypothetical protein JWM34_2529 [Ilumatobacteraceae bacterium]|nr:hypothetical protein [Ilumatobacteraceae bacterium]